MGQLIDGKAIAEKIEQKTAERVKQLKAKGVTPRLEVILVGEDKPSQTYVRRKGLAAERIGMEFKLHIFPSTITTQELIEKTEDIQHGKYISGLIVQLPLPENLYTDEVLNVIHPEIDVDCLTDFNLGKLVMKTNFLVPPTPGAVISILHDLKIPLVGKNVTIIGAGALVGKPLAIMMMNERASVSVCNSKTTDTKERCLASDIIVTGVGRKDILRGDMVKSGAIVIDTGVDFVDGKMYGDVNVEEVKEKAAFVTPTPGGVGPITVARLLWNTVICAERNFENEFDLRNVKCVRYDANQQIGANLQNYEFTNDKMSEDKIIFKKLSFKISGILFKVHNELGRYCNEKQICDKIEFYLKEDKISYERELILPPSFIGEKNGRNRIDFLIDGKIILEIKCKRYIGRDEYYQTQRYLHALDKKLGLLVNFHDERIVPHRVLKNKSH